MEKRIGDLEGDEDVDVSEWERAGKEGKRRRWIRGKRGGGEKGLWADGKRYVNE